MNDLLVTLYGIVCVYILIDGVVLPIRDALGLYTRRSDWTHDVPKPGPYDRLVTVYPIYATVSAITEICPIDERTTLDEDILAAVSWEWSEDVCERYYANLNI